MGHTTFSAILVLQKKGTEMFRLATLDGFRTMEEGKRGEQGSPGAYSGSGADLRVCCVISFSGHAIPVRRCYYPIL